MSSDPVYKTLNSVLYVYVQISTLILISLSTQPHPELLNLEPQFPDFWNNIVMSRTLSFILDSTLSSLDYAQFWIVF